MHLCKCDGRGSFSPPLHSCSSWPQSTLPLTFTKSLCLGTYSILYTHFILKCKNVYHCPLLISLLVWMFEEERGLCFCQTVPLWFIYFLDTEINIYRGSVQPSTDCILNLCVWKGGLDCIMSIHKVSWTSLVQRTLLSVWKQASSQPLTPLLFLSHQSRGHWV